MIGGRHCQNTKWGDVDGKHEYKEVLEHILSRPTSGRSNHEKDLHAARMHEKLANYMDDDEDRDALIRWWNHLADPSGASPRDWNPFNR